jgi:hypothetical protein
LPDPVDHRRRVWFVKPHYWVIVDDLTGAAEHEVAVRWQLAQRAVRLDTEGWARVECGPGELLIGAMSRAPLVGRVLNGSAAPLAGWVAKHYGERIPAPQLVYQASAQLPIRVVTFLVPRRSRGRAVPAVEALHDRRGEIIGVRVRGQRTLRFEG